MIFVKLELELNSNFSKLDRNSIEDKNLDSHSFNWLSCKKYIAGMLVHADDLILMRESVIQMQSLLNVSFEFGDCCDLKFYFAENLLVC